jgi:hypothetical protein
MANLAGAQALIDLALLLRDAAQRQPLYLVHAVPDDASAGDKLGRAEKMLGDAVRLCASADVPAEISTSVDQTIGAALGRATKEVQASHLVLDWNFQQPEKQNVLGSTIDELLRSNASTLVLFRSRHPVSTTQKITLAIPPLDFERAPLAAAAAAVKRIAQQLGAPIEVLAEAKTWALYKDVLQSAKPAVKTTHHPLESWASLKQALLDRTSSSDMLAILGHRDATPEIARTAIEIAERFPDASIALVHGPFGAAGARQVRAVPAVAAAPN